MPIIGNAITLGGSGGGGTQAQNLIPQNATWAPGYFANGGGISNPQSTEKEVYESEYIPVTGGHELFLISRVDHSNPWVGVCAYDSSYGYITRVTVAYSFQLGDTYYGYALMKLSNSAAYIRYSMRTFGLSASAAAYDIVDLMDNDAVVVTPAT